MRIRLALDASLRVPSCAVAIGESIVHRTGQGHPAEGFFDVISRCLADVEVPISRIDEIVACAGPGSYMGVRTCVATANTLGLALDRPVTGVLGVDAAAVVAPDDRTTIGIPAGRNRWFVASYRWVGSRLDRVSAPILTDLLPEPAWVADGRDGSPSLNAQASMLLTLEQPHLVVHSSTTELAPYLLKIPQLRR